MNWVTDWTAANPQDMDTIITAAGTEQAVTILDAGDLLSRQVSTGLVTHLLLYTASQHHNIESGDSLKETSPTHVSYEYLRRQLHAINSPL